MISFYYLLISFKIHSYFAWCKHFFSSFITCIVSFALKFLFDISDLSISKVCSIWFSSGEYSRIVNTIHLNFFTNYFTSFVLWKFTLSNIATILLSYVIFTSPDLNSWSNNLIKSQNWSSLIVLILIIKYASLLHLNYYQVDFLGSQSNNTLSISSSFHPKVKW